MAPVLFFTAVVLAAAGAHFAGAAAGARSAAAPATQIGINLGNTLEEPDEQPLPHGASEAYIAAFAAAGFTLVRVPVRWDKHTSATAPYTVEPAWLARVATVVGWATSRNLSVIVNSHDDAWLDVADEGAFDAALPRFLAIWTQVAAKFAGTSLLLQFEVFNEPHIMSLRSLNAMQAAVHAIIRKADATRKVVVCGLEMEGPWWINSKAAAGLVLPTNADGSDDANLVLQIHDYSPFGFASPPFSIFEVSARPSPARRSDALCLTIPSAAACPLPPSSLCSRSGARPPTLRRPMARSRM